MNKIANQVNRVLRNLKFWRENRLILRELRHFYPVVIWAIVFSLLSALLEGVGVSLLLSFLQSLTRPDAPAFKIGNQLIDVWVLGAGESPESRLIRISTFIILTTWVRSACNYFGAIFIEQAQLKLMHRIRIQIFEQLQSLQLSYFLTTKLGELINTITTENDRLKFVVSIFSSLMTRSLVGGVYFVSMFLISWQLSITALIVLF
jgi:ATP-binding cassette, subfamily B, bacterial MsbA